MQGKLTISLPTFDRNFWKGILSVVALSAFSYWYLAIHPYLVLSDGVVSPFSVPLRSPLEGAIVQELGAEVGERVEKGRLLASFHRGNPGMEREKISSKIASYESEIELEKGRKEKAMHEYLLAGPDVEVIRHHIAVLEEAQGRMEELSQQLLLARSQLDGLQGEAKLYAPFDAIVLEKRKEAGEKVEGEEVIYTLSDPARTWIEARLPERELGKVSLGAPAQITLTAYPRREWRGKVSWIAPVATLQGGERVVTIRVSLNAPDPLVKPGLSAKLRLKISS